MTEDQTRWTATVGAGWPPRVRTAVLVAVGVCFVAAAAAAWWVAAHQPAWDRQMDLHVYAGAARAVQSGSPLYAYVAENGDPFTYPPFALAVFWPLGWVSEPVARMLWTAATLVAVVGIAAAFTSRQGIAGRRRYAALTLAAAGALLWSAPVQSNLRLGQVSVFLVLLALVDALDLAPKPLRGVLTGIAAAVKLTPLLFVPYLWITGRRRDAVRAGVTFAACTGLAHWLWPWSSKEFWTDALFTTSRIGDLAATGNQSLNGALIRAGVVPPERAAAWFALSALVCVVALIGARTCYREGRSAQGAVVMGCATITASPVSWTHHQVWLVLAGLLLIAGPRRARVAWGAGLLVAMTINVGGWMPAGLLEDNVRLIAALAVCTWGLAPLRKRDPASVALLPGVRVVLRPRTGLAYAAVVALAAAGVLVMVRTEPVSAQVRTEADSTMGPWSSAPPCMGYAPVTDAAGALTGYRCIGMVDTVHQLNFSWGYNADQSMVLVEGEVGPDVTRLMFVPVEGTKAISVPMLPKPAPSVPLIYPEARDYLGKPVRSDLPVEDTRISNRRTFGIAASSTKHALLFAYGADGRLLGYGDQKLQDG